VTVTFDIPNGSMEIVLDRFMPEAKIGQIRKAIKLMPDDKKQETAAWLNGQTKELAQKALNCFMLHREEENRIPELKGQVELLKHDQEDKDELYQAKMQLSQCRRLSSQYRKKSEAACKLKKRYEELVEKLRSWENVRQLKLSGMAGGKEIRKYERL